MFFLPFTIFPLALNKQLLLLVLVGIGFISWLIHGIKQKQFVFPSGYFNYFLLALIVFALLSAWFSGARTNGLWGTTGGEINTFVNLLSFGLLFCLAAAVAKESKYRKVLLNLVFVSSAIVLIYSVLQFLGLRILPWQFTQQSIFNPIGTTNALAIYLGTVFVLAFSSFYLSSLYKNQVAKISLIILMAALFVVGFLISFWVTFVGWAIAAILFLLINKKISSAAILNKKSLWVVVILAVALLVILVRFNILPIPLPTFDLPGEVVPSVSASWQISKDTLGEGVKNILFGSGPATYQYKYSLYKNLTLNATPLWNTYFIQGFSAIFTHLAEDGILGSILWLSFFLSVIAGGLTLRKKFLTKKKSASDQAVFWGVFLTLIFLLVSLIFYTQNFVNYFMLFVLSGILIGIVSAKGDNYTVISLRNKASYRLIIIIALIALTFLVIISSLFFQIQHYRGAVYFERAVSATDKEQLDEVISDLSKATKLNSRNETYLRGLSDGYLLRIGNLFNQQATGQVTDPQEIQTKFIGDLDAAIQVAQKATEVNKLSSVNWLNLAKVYENVISLIDGAAEQSFNAYKEAAKLEPVNPIIFTNLGRAYITNEDNKLAIDELEKALRLKGDYAPAHYWLAIAYQRTGESTKALEQIRVAKQLAPEDPDIKKLFNELKQSPPSS